MIEKIINLSVALSLAQKLKTQGHDVKLSRETDVFISLPDRCKMANAWKADLFISIHHNAGGGDGYEVIHSIHFGVGSTIADLIANEFKALGQNAHGFGVYSKESTVTPGHDYYAVIRGTDMPAVISEYAFLDTADFKAIDTPAEQNGESQALDNAVCKYAGTNYAPQREAEAKVHWAQPLLDKAKAKGLITSDHNLDQPLTFAEILAVLNKLRLLD
jgi:N-acetylmuramoyl-L-alanine amidase